MLRDVDVVLFDIPDVGARFFTYVWTLTHIIDACAAAGVPVFARLDKVRVDKSLPAYEA